MTAALTVLALGMACAACEGIVGMHDINVVSGDAGKVPEVKSAPTEPPASDAGAAAPDAAPSLPPPAVDAGPAAPQCVPTAAPRCEWGEDQRYVLQKGETCDIECDCSAGHFCAPVDSRFGVCCRAGQCGASCADDCDCLSLRCDQGRCR